MAISKEAQSVYDLAQFPLKPRSCNLLSDLRIQTRKKIEPSVESVLAEYSVSITEKKISGVNCTCINPEKILIIRRNSEFESKNTTDKANHCNLIEI